MKISIKSKLLLSAVSFGMITASAAPVFAQDDTENDIIVITGSRIQNANIVSSSPVTTLDEDAFDKVGVIDAIDVLNRLPSVTAAQDSNVSNGATGTSSLNLRGLGTERNLVLIDGKRLGPGRPDIATADLNQIPTPLLERAEVVTGGASAVYGSDAIAGVANFILKRDFEGLELNLQYGGFFDKNTSSFAQEVTDLSSTDGVTPSDSQFDGESIDISAVFGTNFANDRGNVTGYVRYVDQNQVLQGTRDISRCAIVDFGPAAGDDVFCVGSNFGPFPTTLTLPTIFETDAAGDPVQFLSNDEGEFVDAAGNVVMRPNAVMAPAGFMGMTSPRQLLGSTAGTVSLDAAGGFTLGDDLNGLGSTNAFNFNPTNFFQRPTKRIQGGFLANYDITNQMEAYVDAFFFRNTTDAQIAPSATFGEISQINCDNPFLTPQLVQTICTGRGFGPTDLATVNVNRRFVEGGGRNTFVELDNLRLVGGIRGDYSTSENSWSYDLFGQYSTTSQTDTNTNDANITLFQEALLVEELPNGTLACTSGSPTCLPLNLFGTSPVDTTALANILTPTILAGEVEQQIIGGTTQGALSFLKSPMAEEAVNFLVGFEVRKDTLRSQPDSILIVGGATGLGGPADPTDASSTVQEVFGEVAVPLVSDAAFAKDLTLTGQIRYSDYSYDNSIPGGLQADGTTSTAYSAGVSWTPIDDIRLRGQYQRAVRAPNVFDLFAPQSINLFSDEDPCSGTIGTINGRPNPASRADCERTGLSPSLFGFVQEDAGQLQQLGGGNTALTPEKSDTFTIGAIIQPSIVPGLTVSLDYFDISVDDFITSVPPASILDGCIDGSQPDFCGFINRDALGTLQIDGFITSTDQNIAERVSKGFDVAVNYGFNDLPYVGDVDFNYITTIYTALEQTSFPGAGVTDCNGFWGGPCNDFTGEVNPTYSHNASLSFAPMEGLGVTATWRHIGSVDSFGDEVPEGGIGNSFASENFVDLFASYEVRENLTLSAGANNIFDNDPPISDFRFTANGNTFPSTYDAIGTYLFVGAKWKL